jgi:hypothetical protein
VRKPFLSLIFLTLIPWLLFSQTFEGEAVVSSTAFGLTADTRAGGVDELPFGTRLRVTNLSNNFAVIVQVNGRITNPMPGEVVALAKAAADNIGIKETYPVEVHIDVLTRPYDSTLDTETVFTKSHDDPRPADLDPGQRQAILNLIYSNYTTAPGNFTSGEIDVGQIDSIMRAGCWAPSAHNDQPWHFTIVSRDRELANTLVPGINAGNILIIVSK